MAPILDGAALGGLVCAGCGGARFRRSGAIHGRELFRCAGCDAPVWGTAPDRSGAPCPYCGKPCVKNGYGKGRRQRYLCRACGRTNCDLMPADRLEDMGGYLSRQRFVLDTAARDGLGAWMVRFGMRETEAVRSVFRASRVVPLGAADRARWETKRREDTEPGFDAEDVRKGRGLARVATAAPVLAHELPRRLPDVRSAVSRARLHGMTVWEARNVRDTGVVHLVSVALDAEAMAGLLRAMEHLGTQNRQEAARFLLAGAVERFGAFMRSAGALGGKRRNTGQSTTPCRT